MKKSIISIAAVSLVGGVLHASMPNDQWAMLKGQTVAADTIVEETAAPEPSIIDEVIWVVGDEAILKSNVEAMRLQGEMEGMKWYGNPDCSIPEQIAV